MLERRKPEVYGKRPKAPKEPERTGGVLVVGPPPTKEEFEKKHGGPQPPVEVEFEGLPSPGDKNGNNSKHINAAPLTRIDRAAFNPYDPIARAAPLGCASRARENETKHVNAAAFRSKDESGERNRAACSEACERS